MNKRSAYILSRCLCIAAIIIFQVVMYYAVGIETLSQKGTMRTFWLVFTGVIPNITILCDIFIEKKYKKR